MEAITIGVEVGVQNETTALFITGTLLAKPEASIVPAIYSLIMFGKGACSKSWSMSSSPRPPQRRKRRSWLARMDSAPRTEIGLHSRGTMES